jgi:5-methyltetrahydropteroyltriglutamate--homocysteine methyltransferase
VPDVPELARTLRAVLTVLPPHQVWVNPDCGLKTRKPEEAWPALENMVAAAREVRRSLRESAPDVASTPVAEGAHGSEVE